MRTSLIFVCSPLFSFSRLLTTSMRSTSIPYWKHSYLSMRAKTTNSKKKTIDTFTSCTMTLRHLSPNYKPKTENQQEYVNCLNHPDVSVVFGIGPAGCGKTLFACLQAIQELKQGAIQKIVLTRPIVPVEDEEIGFLPGNLVNKMDPWTRPIFDIFLEYYTQKDLDGMIQAGVIEIAPLAFMRGRTFKRCFIIADEMQNSTPNQMLMLTTRIGDGSKMVVTGDLKQSDRTVENGLFDVMLKLRKWGCAYDEIKMIEMNEEDIRRSVVVSRMIELYTRPV